MNTQSRFARRLAVSGIIFSALFVAGQVLIGSQPSTKASGNTVVHFYDVHRTADTAAIFAVVLMALAFVFFLGSLRRVLTSSGDGRILDGVITAGTAVYAGGLLLMAMLTAALVDAGRYTMPTTAQTLNVLSNDAWVPVVAGIAMVGLGTGISALRGGALPRWLAWASVVLGVLALAGPVGAIAFLLVPVWTLVVSIVSLRSAGSDAADASHAAVAVHAGRP